MTSAEKLTGLRRPSRALVPERLGRLAQALALSEYERELVQLCFTVETEPEADRAIAELCGEAGAGGVPIAVAHAILGHADWSATSAAGALRRWHVLRPAAPAPRVRQCLRLAETVIDALLGLHALDPLLAELLAPLDGAGVVPRALVAEVAEALARSGDEISPLIVARWHEGGESAATVARALGLRAHRLDLERLAASRVSVRDVQRTLERDSVFEPLALVVEPPPDASAAASLGAFLAELAAHVFVVGDPPPACGRRVYRCRSDAYDLPSAVDQWRSALGPAAGARLNGAVESVAAQFRLSPRAIADAAAGVRLAIEAAADDAAADGLLWSAGARAAWPQPGPLARVIEPKAALDDVVVPAPVRADLDAIVRQVRHAWTVYGRWGFGAQTMRGRGLTALFAGRSGTGKTLAAEAIAAALRLPLVVADFSQLRSKWVGESAKLAARLFDEVDRGGAVLLIDEADGLLGRRIPAADSGDAHGNADVAYFLQRLETFRGLAILTTNLKSSIDDAFLRRYRFVVEFPVPGAAERRRIWERVFPAGAPRAPLDLDALARLQLTGGAIRNVALNAAFGAADARAPIGAEHLLAALRAEYRKLERSTAELEASLAS